MQLQELSYVLNNDKIKVNDKLNNIDYLASIEVISLENVYTAPKLTKNAKEYTCDTLVWGNDVPTKGTSASIEVEDCEQGKVFSAKASLDIPVRSIKIRFDDLPLGKLISSVDQDKTVTEYGICMHYPEGWRSVSWPFLAFELENNKYLYIYCLDNNVNAKKFFIKAQKNGKMRVEVVQEQDATNLSNSFIAPSIECCITDNINEFYKRVAENTKSIYKLEEFENSSIAPSWLKDINLVVIMHMQAFTGKKFHTYDSALEDIEYLTKHIDGKHILVYMAGWEGRYYYKYGNYTPDDRMGGKEQLKRCILKMQALGCKVMLMYGMNMVNKNIPELADIVDKAEFITIGGGKFRNGSVNWEGAHHYDFGELAQLNIGCKDWADNLYNQIKSNVEEFDFDGAFLDIAAGYVNDRRARVYEGVVDFCNRLRGLKKDFLVSGEGYYDGLSKAMPLFQSGHTDGKMHYHDRLNDELFGRFSREFAHLCLGDPWYGSTGVHEQGINTDIQTPLHKAIIPTLSLVDGTIANAPEKVAEIINQAKSYGGLINEKKDD